jgi:hypothetical protein
MATVRQHAADEARAQGRGLRIIAILAVLTIVEYGVAVSVDSVSVLVALLSVAAVAKAWLIMQHFMHFPKVWHSDGGH